MRAQEFVFSISGTIYSVSCKSRGKFAFAEDCIVRTQQEFSSNQQACANGGGILGKHNFHSVIIHTEVDTGAIIRLNSERSSEAIEFTSELDSK